MSHVQIYAEAVKTLGMCRGKVEKAAKTFKEAGESLTSNPTNLMMRGGSLSTAVWGTIGHAELEKTLREYFQAIEAVKKAYGAVPEDLRKVLKDPPEK